MAKFTKYSDHDKVRTSAFEIQQYFAEINAGDYTTDVGSKT